MKKITAIIMAGLMAICLSACGNVPNSDSVIGEQYSPGEIADKVLEAVDFPSATEKTIDDISDYIDVNVSDIKEMAYYICGSGAYPDELLILKLKGSNYAKDTQSAVRKRLDSQIETYKDYTPDEMYKLDDARIYVNENWIFFFATADNDKVSEIINSFFQSETAKPI